MTPQTETPRWSMTDDQVLDAMATDRFNQRLHFDRAFELERLTDETRRRYGAKLSTPPSVQASSPVCAWRAIGDGAHVESDAHPGQWFGREVVTEWTHCPYCGKPLSLPATEGATA